MNKEAKLCININKILLTLVIFFSFFFCINYASANTYSNIEMDVYIDKSGNASVTEVWKANLTEDTELYRSYTNIGNASISNFSVSDDSGKTYSFLNNWNVKANFDSKKYKCGIHSVENGIELCWGISKYGSRTYTLKYNINNFVNQYTDIQGIYFNFLDLSVNVENAKITIHSDTKFSESNSKIWAFGNNGTINFVNGNIEFESGGRLSRSQYMVALVKFESNLYNTQNKVNKSFKDIYDESMIGAEDKEEDEDESIGEIISDIKASISEIKNLIVSNPIILILNPFSIILLIVIFIVIFGKNNKKGKRISNYTFDFGSAGNLLPADEDINYFRDIPCNKDIERAYWVCYNYNIISSATLKQGIIGAILLKWIRDGYVSVTKTRKGLFSFKDNNYAIDFTKMTGAKNEIENELYNIMISASGNNRILEAKEFEKWCKNKYYKLNTWFANIMDKETLYLEKQGLIKEGQKEVKGILGVPMIKTVKFVNEKLKDEAIQLKGLKKFLNDFSMMPEREYFEVHMWEEYLMLAELFGIAEKVEEQFSKLYPKFNQETLLKTDVTTVAARNIAKLGYESSVYGYKLAEERRESRNNSSSSSSNYSTGSGGSSYSGGGRSAGGSSGGGSR